MTNEEKTLLTKAILPLEVLCGQISVRPYKEMTLDFQEELLKSYQIIRILLFNKEVK